LKYKPRQVQAYLSKWLFTEMPVVCFGGGGETAYKVYRNVESINEK